MDDPPLVRSMAREKPGSLLHHDWLERVTASILGPGPNLQQAGEQGVIYSLHLSRRKPWGFEIAITVGVSRRLKSGRWGAPREVTNALAPPDSVRSAYREEDHRLCRELAALTPKSNTYHYYKRSPISGHPESGELFLRLLQTGRLRIDQGHELAEGPEQQALLQWCALEDGLWTIEVTCPEGVPILTQPPFWLDRKSGRCGALHDLSEQAVQALYRIPEWEYAEAIAAEQLLSRILPQLAPLPKTNEEGPLETISPYAPVFLCTVCEGELGVNMMSYNGHWSLPAQALLPMVRYGEALLPLNPREIAAQLPGGITIPRDVLAEERHLQQLRAMGLVSSRQQHLQFTPANRLEMDAPATTYWLQLGDLQPNSRPRVQPPAGLEIPNHILSRLWGGGWQPYSAKGQIQPTVLVADQWEAEVEEEDSWFSIGLGIHVNGQRIDALPLLRQLAGMSEEAIALLPRHGEEQDAHILLAVDDKHLIALPEAQIRDLYRSLIELFTRDGSRMRVSRWDLETADALRALGTRWSGTGSEHLLRMQQDLRQLGHASQEPCPPPAGLQATLRPYQQEGLAWMLKLAELGLGGLLADDMGLGKTVQTLALILAQVEAGRWNQGILVVAPVSTLGNWLRESRRFTPALSVHCYHGPQRNSLELQGEGPRVILTSYATLTRDRLHFGAREWSLVVCDEAQGLKNPTSRQGQAIRSLRASMRLALTGTPMENHLGELWALMHWVEPGLLGSRAAFDRSFRAPIEKLQDRQRQADLARRIRPVLLRRTKEMVLSELPPRTDLIHRLELGPHQSALYESIRAAMDDQVRSAIAAKGLARSHLEFLEALLRLRQICCHPPLVPTRSARNCPESAKLDFLRELLPELIDEGRRILLFSQFTGLLDHIAALCQEIEQPYVRLDGQTRNRQSIIDRFQTGSVPLFLISLKAGGMGLNLTAADTVILTDPWWNPAVEQQAIDRAHRIGQTDPVFVHRLIIGGSVEERVLELQQHKRDLAAGLFDANGQSLTALSENDITQLLQPIDP
ncbi:MAG: DEAD/DEAH box helicase [Planctomycetota bacterium]|nr:MAG: DEAD/DEAH box helicase [Planctomycetota bacterium]